MAERVQIVHVSMVEKFKKLPVIRILSHIVRGIQALTNAHVDLFAMALGRKSDSKHNQ